MSKVLYKPMVVVGQPRNCCTSLTNAGMGRGQCCTFAVLSGSTAIPSFGHCENARSKLFKCSANVLPMTMMSSTYTRQVVPCRPLRTKLESLKGGRCISKDKRHDVEFKKPFSFAQSSLFASIHFQVPPANSRW